MVLVIKTFKTIDEQIEILKSKGLEFKDIDYAKDVLLREGDAIFVPEYLGTVTVSGDVFFPNTVSYESGKGYKYYVNQAGGFGNRAKKSKAFIVYQNGTVGVVSQGAKPEPGCEIVVPSKKNKQPFNWAAIAGITSGLTGIAALILAISRL